MIEFTELPTEASDDARSDPGHAPEVRASEYVLKDGDFFAVFEADGNINGPYLGTEADLGTAGLYYCDTRYLSRLTLKINGRPLIPLGSSISGSNVEFRADLSNRQCTDLNGQAIATNALHVLRQRVLEDGLWEFITVTNYSSHPLNIDLSIESGADFRDIFEVRGSVRKNRGRLVPPRIGQTDIFYGYQGLNGKSYHTTVSFSRPPLTIEGRSHFNLDIAPGGRQELQVSVRVDASAAENPPKDFAEARSEAHRTTGLRLKNLDSVKTSNSQFNAWLRRSSDDLALLATDFPTGPYPYAGIPWFSVPFGRDAIFTALETVWLEPDLALGVLKYLAAHQAESVSLFQDSAPGKILHETRKGEMANLGEVPFEAYYGGVDTTPLFIVLAGAYFRRTADLDAMQDLWPAIRSALHWIETYGDHDGDGFLEYQRGAEKGLKNQGWKDSGDAIFYQDGQLVDGGVALVEVQAYVIAAYVSAAEIAAALGEGDLAKDLRSKSDNLSEKFDATFWNEDLGTYVIGLDAVKRPLKVRSSNAFHPLFVGAAKPQRAATLAELAISESFFSGWGIRTIARGEARYNPMAYHNGSVWPHDNAVAAAGFGRYGHKEEAGRILTALFDAACGMNTYRLPELYCGFDRHNEPRPVAYPGACAPQAWAAAVPFLCLAGCLGIEIDAAAKTVRLDNPAMPLCLDWLKIDNLIFGEVTTSLMIWRGKEQIEAEIVGLPADYAFSVDRNQPPD